MEKHTLIYRKFLSEESEAFVSVRSDTWENGVIVDTTISDGYNAINVSHWVASDADDPTQRYEKALLELDTLKNGILAAQDELVDAYGKQRFSSLDDDILEDEREWALEQESEDYITKAEQEGEALREV